MDKSIFAAMPTLTPTLGFASMIGLGLFSLALSYAVKMLLVRNTHDFIIADRRVGFGFGVGSVIAVWTWAMAVMMSSAMTFQWGLSGLFWFVVPNGFAVMAMIPFARILRKNMPEGYTISEFVEYRFGRSKAATAIVTVTMVFGIILEILINLKGTSVVVSTVFGIDWKVATIVGIICVLTYSYFGGLWTSVMTGTLNTLMITVPAAIVVAAVYARVPGGASAVFDAAGAADARNLSVLRPDAAAGFGITLAFGLLAATVSDQTFWQKVWAVKSRDVGRTFLWSGALFYPIPICLGMLGLVGIAYHLTPADIGGDIVAIGPYIVSHIGLGLTLVLLYVLVILAACYSTIDGASAALSSIVAVDIVKRYFPHRTVVDRRRRHRQTVLSADLGKQPVRHHQALGPGWRHRRDADRAVRARLHHAGAHDLCVEDVDPAAARAVHSLAEDQHGRLRGRDRRRHLDRHADLRDGG
jgi:Na+/proline symporter